MQKTAVENLFDHPQHVSTIIEWIRREWPKDETINQADVEFRLCGNRLPNQLPAPLIALNGRAPVGYVSLIHFETEECNGKLFWVDGLYVIPEFRGIGLGSTLLQAASERGANLGLPYLCAYTEEVSLYSRNGWRPISLSGANHGPIVMEKLLRGEH